VIAHLASEVRFRKRAQARQLALPGLCEGISLAMIGIGIQPATRARSPTGSRHLNESLVRPTKRATPMKHEPAPRHHAPNEPPQTVIHHYEEDQTLLARWLSRAIAKGPSFWILVGGSVAAVVTVAWLVSWLFSAPSQVGQGWQEMILASSTEDFQRLAETQAETAVGPWAALQVATARYRDAFNRLPADRDSAGPILEQALEGFREVEREAKDNPMIRRLAMVGIARSLETQDQLPEAIAAYQAVAKEWPDSLDGKSAAKRAAQLKDPEVIAFYRKFETYKPKASTTIGPRGTNLLDLPKGHPALDGPIMPAPSLDGGVRAGAVGNGELPPDVFQKSKSERDATVPPDPKNSDLPDVFPDEKPKTPATPK
jgi:hypothetical protein